MASSQLLWNCHDFVTIGSTLVACVGIDACTHVGPKQPRDRFKLVAMETPLVNSTYSVLSSESPVTIRAEPDP